MCLEDFERLSKATTIGLWEQGIITPSPLSSLGRLVFAPAVLTQEEKMPLLLPNPGKLGAPREEVALNVFAEQPIDLSKHKDVPVSWGDALTAELCHEGIKAFLEQHGLEAKAAPLEETVVQVGDLMKFLDTHEHGDLIRDACEAAVKRHLHEKDGDR
jgi:hypothetical protein